MTAVIIRRVCQLVVVVWGTVTLLFLLFFILPSDPARIIAGGTNRNPDPQVVQNVRVKYGFDQPVIVQYGRYLKRFATLDLGTSFRDHRPVLDIIEERAPASLRLAFWAILLEAFVGIGAGVMAARRKGSFAGRGIMALAAVASAIPVFLFAHLLQQFTGVYTYEHGLPTWMRLPVEGIGPNSWVLGVIPSSGQWRYLIQPVIVLAAVSTLLVARLTRGSLLEVSGRDFIRTARSKGLTEGAITRRHGLRNAMIPVVTNIGLDFGALVGSVVVTEYVFNWPGLGSKIAVAASGRDLPVLIGGTIVVVIVYGLVNLAVDLSYTWFDPRVRFDAGRR